MTKVLMLLSMRIPENEERKTVNDKTEILWKTILLQSPPFRKMKNKLRNDMNIMRYDIMGTNSSICKTM